MAASFSQGAPVARAACNLSNPLLRIQISLTVRRTLPVHRVAREPAPPTRSAPRLFGGPLLPRRTVTRRAFKFYGRRAKRKHRFPFDRKHLGPQDEENFIIASWSDYLRLLSLGCLSSSTAAPRCSPPLRFIALNKVRFINAAILRPIVLAAAVVLLPTVDRAEDQQVDPLHLPKLVSDAIMARFPKAQLIKRDKGIGSTTKSFTISN